MEVVVVVASAVLGLVAACWGSVRTDKLRRFDPKLARDIDVVRGFRSEVYNGRCLHKDSLPPL